jgi:hypothetical protein
VIRHFVDPLTFPESDVGFEKSQIAMEYDLYHDESKVGGYWHGMLLVPRRTREILLRHLEQVRSNTQYSYAVALKGLNKTSGIPYRMARAWISIGNCALIQTFRNKKAHIYTGKDGLGPGIDQFHNLIGARFILFRVRDDHEGLTGYKDHAAKIETTFRMGLKGGMHLFSKTSIDAFVVKSFHFDGYEHYQRRVDAERIVGRLGDLREGVSIADDFMIYDGPSDHRKPECQDYDDCQLLQLTDLLVSGFRTVLGQQTHDAQRVVSLPLQELATKWSDGYARMQQSRWFGGFCISECFIENQRWVFSDILPETRQTNLF